ncbi:kinase-like domain-containing protein [Lentinula aciculospora]|uniref:Kinase-like domain-containing protein n=1 Tax=Lentinula aciculospora TaxID=153920 RepID=A0A9W9DHC5_9AGAR|nr:kinase-like domain-containing protein [Lentinula aciculospora]
MFEPTRSYSQPRPRAKFEAPVPNPQASPSRIGSTSQRDMSGLTSYGLVFSSGDLPAVDCPRSEPQNRIPDPKTPGPEQRDGRSMLHYAAADGPPSSAIFEWPGGSLFTFPYKDDTTRTVHLKRVLFRSKSIIGQGTIVVRVECNCNHCEWYGKKLILKLSFPSKTRVSEQTFMDRCKALTQGDHAWVLKHLPHIYWSFDVYFQANTPNADLKERFKDDYEILETAKDCAQVFYDVVQCHHWAWKYPKILHRDISQGNIMVREKDGEKYGVLNDWDLSSWINEQRDGPTSKFRTGTKPYMAHEQHSYGWQGPHRFRHDLESLFYVILLLACLYTSPSAKHTAPMSPSAQDFEYEEWHKQDDRFLYQTKAFVINVHAWTPPVLPFFLGFTVWLINLQRALGYGFFALREHWDFLRLDKQFKSFDQDTLDNYLSYETVVSIMHRFREEELKTRGSEWQEILLRPQPFELL